MNKKVTITDVAQAAGVSISSVHQALNNKPGVSEATRDHIRQVAAQMGYQPNRVASVLKRRTQHIAVLLPDTTGKHQYYFPPLWQGVHDYLQEASDWSVDCREVGVSSEHTVTDTMECRELLDMILYGEIDGLLTSGDVDPYTPEEWAQILDTNIPIVRTGFERVRGQSLCRIQPDYEMIGRTMAELILRQIPPYGSVVLCGGNPAWEQHADIVRGFMAYMQEIGRTNRIYRNEIYAISDEARAEILTALEQPDVAACAAVNSQGSVMLADGLRTCGKADRVFAVGSDAFAENLTSLREGTFDNLMYKNPYAQGYLGMKTLLEYILLGRQPQSVIRVGSEVIFHSNADIYVSGRRDETFL